MTGKGMGTDTKKDAPFWVRNYDVPPDEAPPIKMEVGGGSSSSKQQHAAAGVVLVAVYAVAAGFKWTMQQGFAAAAASTSRRWQQLNTVAASMQWQRHQLQWHLQQAHTQWAASTDAA
jgi:hypothetical protein